MDHVLIPSVNGSNIQEGQSEQQIHDGEKTYLAGGQMQPCDHFVRRLICPVMSVAKHKITLSLKALTKTV